MTDITTHRMSGLTCTRSSGRLIIWNGHLCEGANLTPPRVDNFCLWSRCASHDVPADAAHEGDLGEVTCPECRAIYDGRQNHRPSWGVFVTAENGQTYMPFSHALRRSAEASRRNWIATLPTAKVWVARADHEIQGRRQMLTHGVLQRTDQDYAIEHGRYLAAAARDMQYAIKSGNPDEIGEALLVLERCVHEFEKRADKCSVPTGVRQIA